MIFDYDKEAILLYLRNRVKWLGHKSADPGYVILGKGEYSIVDFIREIENDTEVGKTALEMYEARMNKAVLDLLDAIYEYE